MYNFRGIVHQGDESTDQRRLTRDTRTESGIYLPYEESHLDKDNLCSVKLDAERPIVGKKEHSIHQVTLRNSPDEQIRDAGIVTQNVVSSQGNEPSGEQIQAQRHRRTE